MIRQKKKIDMNDWKKFELPICMLQIKDTS